jgi:hypothetical protein
VGLALKPAHWSTAVPAERAATPPVPEVLLPRRSGEAQGVLPLAADGVQRWVWESRYGVMLIEVIGPDVFVNGQRVEPHAG